MGPPGGLSAGYSLQATSAAKEGSEEPSRKWPMGNQMVM